MRFRLALFALLIASLPALAGCQGSQSAREPLPTVVLGASSQPGAPAGSPRPASPSQAGRPSAGVVASAKIAPAEEAALALGVGGRIAALQVAKGDRVEAGQLLLTLDDQAAQAQLAQAQAALAAAQASHDLLVAGPSTAELGQAQAALDGARAALSALLAAPRAEHVAQAEAALASARAALALVVKHPTALEVEAARIGIEQAKGALWAAQSSRDYVCGSSSLRESQCDGAEAQISVADAGVKQAENQLAQLQRGADRESVEQAQQAVRMAEAQLALALSPVTEHDIAGAQAQVDGAQAALDALKAGPKAAQLDAAQAQIASAQAQIAAVQAQIDALRLNAPFGGTITDLAAHAGQWVVPGQVAVTLADVGVLRAETTDLSELDVPSVAIGQAAIVTIEALAQDLPGQVSAIAPLADSLGGDVVYKVTVTLEQQPEDLRAGMSAEVVFGSR